MGVPKFYRWISERYPCLSEVVKDYQLPEFDNLYLDMNGIVHNCSHPEDDNPHFRITEEKIFQGIFHYIEVLFRMIKPRKVFFMAIDGVAPRAKMNQQRGRRFRSAREAEELVKKALENGESLPTEERFDSNCITPGTEFMVRLHEALKYLVAKKVSTDTLWQGVRIFLSGHETPGEGEHKIMDFIRTEKAQDGYDSNTRHCLYGLDADLIMLGLTSHEPHFSLLREEVKFGGKNSQKRSTAVEETTFHLLHLSLMREYLGYEFSELETKLSFPYSVENIIDDWVLMGFLVGNDFIPHLPHLHIHQDCLPLLWTTYKRVLPKLDGYLNEGGYLNLERFEKYLFAVSQIDMENFQENLSDMKWADGKLRRLEKYQDDDEGNGSNGARVKKITNNSLGSDVVGIPTADEFMKMRIQDDVDPGHGIDDVSADEDEDDETEDEDDEKNPFHNEFVKFKANYYIEKMDFEKVTPAVLESQSHGYVKAIQWILHYYYNGVQSWSWYYPHHYAPYLSDIRNFKDIQMDYELGRPFLPFQQLMAVLPTASKSLLPKPLQSLMVNDTSPVIDYYPVNFLTDLNGKQQEWEAVVLIPFIEEDRLIGAMEPLLGSLSPSEKARNSHGPHLLFVYSADSLGPLSFADPEKYPTIVNNYAKLTEVPKDAFSLPVSQLRKGLCPGVRQDLYFPGFPTLKHIPHTAELRKASVKVFQMPSRNENMILNIKTQPQPELEEAAQDLVGRSVFIGWPHLIEAFIVSVANDEIRYNMVDPGGKELKPADVKDKVQIYSKALNMDEQQIWHKEAASVAERYMNRLGVVVGEPNLLIYARPMSGRKYLCGSQGLVTLEKQWYTQPVQYLYQTIVKDICIYDQGFTQFKTLDELFPPKKTVFLLGNPHYGSMGEVLKIETVNDDARVRASFTVTPEPSFRQLKAQQGSLSTRYAPAYSVAQRIGITPHLLSRITGTVFLMCGSRSDERPNRLNIGLNLKFNKTNQEVPGYTMKENGDWLYSNKVVDVVSDYIKEFPNLFDKIKESKFNDNYYTTELFPKEPEVVKKLTEYVNKLACRNVAPANHGSCMLDELIVKEIELEVNRNQDANKSQKKKSIKMQVRPHLLYQPLSTQATLNPDPKVTFELFDRVVNVREGYSVPLGLRGTIIGISAAEKAQDVVFEVVFDEEFFGGLTLRCSPSRAYRLPSSAMICLTYNERRDEPVTPQQRDNREQSAAVGNNRDRMGGRTQSYQGQRQQTTAAPGGAFPQAWGGNGSQQNVQPLFSQKGRITLLARPQQQQQQQHGQRQQQQQMQYSDNRQQQYQHQQPQHAQKPQQYQSQPQQNLQNADNRQQQQQQYQQSQHAQKQPQQQSQPQQNLQKQQQQVQKQQQQQQQVQPKAQTNNKSQNQSEGGKAGADYAQIWSQLCTVPVTHVPGPAVPRTEDLRPPQAWLQLSKPSSIVAPSSTSPMKPSVDSVQSPSGTDDLARLFSGISFRSTVSLGVDGTPLHMNLSRMQSVGEKDLDDANVSASPAAIVGHRPGTAGSYGRQVTLDELFGESSQANTESLLPPQSVIPHGMTHATSLEADWQGSVKPLTSLSHPSQGPQGRLVDQNKIQAVEKKDLSERILKKKTDQSSKVFYNSAHRTHENKRLDLETSATAIKIEQHSQQQQLMNSQQQQLMMQQQMLEQQRRQQQQDKMSQQQQQQQGMSQQQPQQHMLIAQQQMIQHQYLLQQQEAFKNKHIQQQIQQQQQQHGFVLNRNELALITVCQRNGWLPPVYKYTLPDGKHQATVTLSNGSKFIGSMSKSQIQASESAAAVAVYNLTSGGKFKGPPSSKSRESNDSGNMTGFSTSTNSAFSSFSSAVPGPAQAHQIPGSLSMLPPGRAYQYGPPPQAAPLYPVQSQSAREGSANDDVKVSKHMDGGEKGIAQNHFIPTQVLRQQKTPQVKDLVNRSDDTSVRVGVPPPVPSDAGVLKESLTQHERRVTEPIDNSLLVQIQHISSVVNTEAPTTTPNASQPVVVKKQKKSKSRIAANFSGTPQSG